MLKVKIQEALRVVKQYETDRATQDFRNMIIRFSTIVYALYYKNMLDIQSWYLN